MLEKTKRIIKTAQSTETCNIGKKHITKTDKPKQTKTQKYKANKMSNTKSTNNQG